MYPYRTRTQWFLGGRYAHLVKAANQRRRTVQDSTLDARVANLKTWNLIRFIVSIPLSAGVVATAGSVVARVIPGGLAEEVVESVLAYATTLTGLLTLLYLFLTRLLGQLEIDILAILTLENE